MNKPVVAIVGRPNVGKSMTQKKYSVAMHQLVSEFRLDVRYGPEGYLDSLISSATVNRPALPLTGFYEYFDSDNIQVIGKAEGYYLRSRSYQERMASMLGVLRQSGRRMSELHADIAQYPQVTINVPMPNDRKRLVSSLPEVETLRTRIADAFAGHGRVVIRPSGTEPKVRVMSCVTSFAA